MILFVYSCLAFWRALLLAYLDWMLFGVVLVPAMLSEIRKIYVRNTADPSRLPTILKLFAHWTKQLKCSQHIRRILNLSNQIRRFFFVVVVCVGGGGGNTHVGF